MQVNGGHPPRLANGFRASGHLYIVEMSDAFCVNEIGDKKLAAPEPAIRAESKSVHRYAYDFAFDTVVGHAAGDVRVMMLDSDFGFDFIERQRVFRREVFGMQIVSDYFRAQVERAV